MEHVNRWLRRLRAGPPIIVVSGLPRSGTSMVMRMLEQGGVQILTDEVRLPDARNPGGYFEFAAVKTLDKGNQAWLRDARGKAVKIVSWLVTWLPEGYDYRVILMQRELEEVIASQDEMLRARGVVADPVERTRRLYVEHLEQVRRFLDRRKCFVTLEVDYRAVIEQPHLHASRIAEFLGSGLDLERMAAVVDSTLYHYRV
jgi:hypothetical protein